MNIKFSIVVVFVLCCFSCKKNAQIPEVEAPKLSKFQILTQYERGSGSSNLIIDLTYDNIGRLTEINNWKFYYNPNGKVAYSRLARGIPGDQSVERYSYRWDEQGRLKEVYLDSMYRKGTSDFNSTVQGISLKNILVSSYTYESNATQPSKITYKKIIRGLGDYFLGIGEEEDINYDYINENIRQSKAYQFLDKDNYLNYLASDYTIFIYNKYSDYINPLYEIYNQMGFNPFDFNSVMSKNIQSTYYSHWDYFKEHNNYHKFDWSESERVITSLDKDERISQVKTLIKANGKNLGKIEYNFRYGSIVPKNID